MASPPFTPRQQPTGFKMGDGYRTVIAMANAPAISFWEKSVKPFGYDGGEPIDTTTMLNNRWRTFQPRALITATPITGKAGFDPEVLLTIQAQINVQQAFTTWFPTDDAWAFWGFLYKFDVEEQEEGKFPMANFEIRPTNWDPIRLVEAGPAIQNRTGTGGVVPPP